MWLDVLYYKFTIDIEDIKAGTKVTLLMNDFDLVGFCTFVHLPKEVID
jgi:hypothetical protein